MHTRVHNFDLCIHRCIKDWREEMTDINTLIKALRCSASPYTDNKNCTECQYRLQEEVKDDLPVPYDAEIDGKKYWISCDCDRIVLDAAEMLEKLEVGDTDASNGA